MFLVEKQSFNLFSKPFEGGGGFAAGLLSCICLQGLAAEVPFIFSSWKEEAVVQLPGGALCCGRAG